MEAQVEVQKGQSSGNAVYKTIQIIEPEIVTRPPWGIVVKGRYSVVIYDRNGTFKEVKSLVVYPRTPLGAWTVWGIKYKGKWYSSLVANVYPYLTLQEGKENPKRR